MESEAFTCQYNWMRHIVSAKQLDAVNEPLSDYRELKKISPSPAIEGGGNYKGEVN